MQNIGDHHGEGSALGSLGLALLENNQYSESQENLEASLKILEETGDRFGEAMVLKSLAQLYQIFGKPDVALLFYNQSLDIARELEIPLVEECQELIEKLLEEYPEIESLANNGKLV